MSSGVVITQALFRQLYCWDFTRQLSYLSCIEVTVPQEISWSSGTYNLPAPSSTHYRSHHRCRGCHHRCRGCTVGIPIWVGPSWSVVFCILISCFSTDIVFTPVAPNGTFLQHTLQHSTCSLPSTKCVLHYSGFYNPTSTPTGVGKKTGYLSSREHSEFCCCCCCCCWTPWRSDSSFKSDGGLIFKFCLVCGRQVSHFPQ